MTTAHTSSPAISINVREIAAVAIGGVLLMVSLLGLDWSYVPASPETGTSATSLSFQDLNAATAASPSGLQAAFFGWFAWALFGALIILAVATLLTNSPAVAIVTAVSGVIVLVLTTLALKGPMTWGQTIEGLPNTRLGCYLAIIGVLVVTIYGVIKSVRGLRSTVASG